MNHKTSEVLSTVMATQLALESLRTKDVPRALEFLEVNLDAGILTLSKLVKEGDPAQREQAILVLRQIRAYRQLHPRRVEADLSMVASGVLGRSAQLAAPRVREILNEIE
jgi:hypothetical protein